MVVDLASPVTVDSIVSTVKQQAVIPNTASLFSAANVANLLDDMMRKRVIPLVKKLKEEYWVTTLATAISASVNAYPIPYRAVGHALRDVSLLDTNQNQLYLVRYEPEDLKFPLIPYNSPYFALGYYLQDFNVILFPPQVANYTNYSVLMKYERRPSNLTLSTNCGQITSFSQVASTITLSFVPTSWSTNTTLDIINNLPPFNSIADDVVITLIAGLTLTITVPTAFSSTFWSNVAANYWCSRSMTSPIPQIPYEAFPYLTALGKKAVLSGVGDVNMLKEADQDIEDAKVELNSMLTPRVEGTPKTLSGFGGIINYGNNRVGNLGLMLTTVLQATGIQTNTNKLSVQSGGLVQADNCVIDKKDVVEVRRGFNPVGAAFAFAGDADNLYIYQAYTLASNGTSLAYDSANNPSNPTWSIYSGSYVPPDGAVKIHAVEGVNSNLYFTTSSGIGKLDTIAGTPYAAGGVKALDGTATVLATGAGWFVNTSNVAYQVVWGYIDVNGNTVLGNPSQIINASNNSGAPQNVSLTFTVPSGLTTSYFWQLYRSAQTSSLAIVAGVQFQLVAQQNLTAPQIAAKAVTYTDQTPDNLKGAYLYTDTTQQGPLQTNDPPPLALDMCYWKNMMFYLNIQSNERTFATVISVGATDGIQNGDTFVITLGATVLTFTGAGTQDPTVPQFKVDTSSTPAANIDATARNLVACINQYAGNTIVYAYYVSGYQQLPGQILLEARSLGTAAFTLTSSRGGAYSPTIPASGVTYTSTNTQEQNGVAISKVGQPEAVPLVNLLPVGAADQVGYRILPLTDAVYVLKQDGVFRITGDNPSNLVVTVAYPDTILTVPESAVVLNNSIYAYTNQGIVTINQSEPQLLSFPIEDQLLPLQTITNFTSMSFGVAYPADRKYVFSCPSESDDVHPTQDWVYNYITQAWTRWDRAFTGGVVNTIDNRLYFASVAAGQLVQERKTYTVMDYADESFTCNITNFSGTTITVNSTTDAVVGMSLAQPNTQFPNLPVTSVITEVTDATHVEVADELQWDIGAAAFYTAIECTVGYAPAHGGFPLYLKHYTMLNFEMDQLTARTVTGQISSDLSPYKEDLEITPVLLGFGEVPFGSEDFGGVGFNLQPLAALVPQEKARAHWINVYINQAEALRKFVLAGATAQYEITSTRMH